MTVDTDSDGFPARDVATDRSPILRLGPYLVVILTVLLVVEIASSSVTNFDTFFHLRIGQEFSHGWSLRHPGHFNRFASRDWLPTQWLTQIWMYRFEEWFGLGGVAWLSGLWFLGLAATLLVICRRHASPIVATAVVATTLLACRYGLSPRPQVLSYILIAIVVDAWLRTDRDGRPRWWLIPLAWLWAMLHGMWILGVVTSFVGAAAMWIDRSKTRKARWSFLGIPVGMAFAGAITPVGPGLYSAVLLVGSRSDLFTEWKPADYTQPPNAALAVMLVASVGLSLRSRRSTVIEIGFLLLTMGWALYTQRTVPIAAVTLAPLLAGQLALLTSPRMPMRRGEKATLTVIISLGLVVLGFTAHRAGEVHEPSWVRPQLQALPNGTPLIADMAPAGYLIWRYQNVAPLITGYADMYTDRELANNRKLMALDPGWDEQVRRLDVHWALVDPKSAIAYALTHFEHWRTVGTSKYVVLLTDTVLPPHSSQGSAHP
ncbi:MAG TPA: hypothetical protein VHO29_06010 [Marmoricola sp.]|nr:hypothetical protein [Marmoricola sp.]